MIDVDKFLDLVLGVGSPAIKTLIKAQPELEQVIIPRTIISWVSNISEYSGLIPGTSIRFVLQKNSNDNDGAIDIKGNSYIFRSVPIEHVASAVLVSMDISPDQSQVHPVNLARLGKTIDSLVKSKPKAPEFGPKAAAIKPLEPEPPIPTQPKQTATKTPTKLPKLPKLPKVNKPKPDEASVALLKFLKDFKV